MTLSDAKTLKQGEYVMSPHSDTPFRPLRITQVSMNEKGSVVMIRVNGLASVTAMAGGWADATAFTRVPSGFTWDRGRGYVKRDKEGIVLERIAIADLRALCAVSRDLVLCGEQQEMV